MQANIKRLAQASFDEICKRTTETMPPAKGKELLGREWGIDCFAVVAAAFDFDLEDMSLYVMAYLIGCDTKTPMRIQEAPFVAFVANQLKGVNCTKWDVEMVLAHIRSVVVEKNAMLRRSSDELRNFNRFLYMWTVKHYANSDKDALQIAQELWQQFYTTDAVSTENLFMHYHRFAHLDDWIEFVSTDTFSKGANISLDLWTQLLPFSEISSYTNYDPSDAWPVAVDLFVEWLKGGKKKSENEAK